VTERVAVLGGSGKTGRAVRAALDARGVASVSLGRADWPDLAAAVAGCDAAYLVAPNLHPDEPRYVVTALSALHDAGVGRVVYHSVASPYVPAMPHHVGKAAAEDHVRRGAPRWTILQPGAYLQNLPLDGSPVRVAYRPDAPFGFAHLPDVAEAAAAVLADDGHEGATYELASFRATAADVAEAVGASVEVVAPGDWARTDGAALAPLARDWLVAMFAYYDRYGLPAGTLPMAALLGRAPTGLADAVRSGTSAP
jgi:uncharacterized protein YbjT (DUF2867 family)